MNASQRRVSRRAIASLIPAGSIVKTATGSTATVIDHTPRHAVFKFKNNRIGKASPRVLSLVG